MFHSSTARTVANFLVIEAAKRRKASGDVSSWEFQRREYPGK